MLYAVILLCAIANEPAFCSETNAIKFVHVPNGSDTPMGCFHNAQTYAAEHDFVVGEDRYLLIHCTSHSFGSPA